jgi:hypothetical protein
VKYGRDEETWEQLIVAGLGFLEERARLQRQTSYTELNATLTRRTGYPSFNFEEAAERAAMGYLLGRIVERNIALTGVMISALVQYLGENDAGPGFYTLAMELGLLARNADSDRKLGFWIEQLNRVYAWYATRG